MTSHAAQLCLPYIGITGPGCPEDVQVVSQKWFDLFEWPAGYLFMNGVLVSHHTLTGEEPDNPRKYRPLGEISGMMVAESRFFNVLHFNTRDLNSPRLHEQMEALSVAVPGADGIQLNIAWPEEAQLRAFRGWSSWKIILQVGASAYRQAGSSPETLVERLKAYEGIVDYVLFDSSGGVGLPLDMRAAKPVLATLTESGLPFMWGMAGGFSGDTMDKLRELRKIYPMLSWDAEGRLRHKDTDLLSRTACFDYLRASARSVRLGR